MTISQALSEGLMVTVVGITIVFSVLLILMFVLMAMKAIFYKKPKASVTAVAPKTTPDTATADSTDSDIDEKELIAVLTAAIAASLNTSTYNLNIKSYRKIGNSSPSWNKAGLDDVINSRF